MSVTQNLYRLDVLKCTKQNIVQIGEDILHHVYQNLKVCKIEGSTL